MKDIANDLHQAVTDVSTSSTSGVPFLIAYELTFFIRAILSFFMLKALVALVALFQGGIALPLAFWLERCRGSRLMASNHPPVLTLMAIRICSA